MLGQNDDVLNFGYDVHIDAAILIFRVDVRHCPSLMVVRTIALEEMALSTLSIPSAAEAGREFVNQRAFRSVLQ